MRPSSLYCSDECQLAELSATCSGLPLDPARDDPTSTAAPITRSNYSSSETESDDSSSPATPSSIHKLAKLYNFPPLPPAPPTFDDSEVHIPIFEYNSGVMIAGRLVSSLCSPPAKPHLGPHPPPLEARQPVPGWTDGSNAWRAWAYNFAAPPQNPYGSLMASPHRPPRASSSLPHHFVPPPPSHSSSSDEMMAKFSQSFQRRSHTARSSLHDSAPAASGAGSLTSDSDEERSSQCASSLPRYPKRPTVESESFLPSTDLQC
jgi:hypothetical protein